MKIMGFIYDKERPKLKGNVWAIKTATNEFKIFVPKQAARVSLTFSAHFN